MDTHREFISGPIIDEVRRHPAGPFGVDEIRNNYIVESDISSFYDYIDHEQLRAELEIWSDKFESIDGLMQFLEETGGRGFGIPQPSIASDWLSEIYAQRIERDLVRQGLNVWRFNDDFRMACETYADALDAIDKLASAARNVGLNVNEYKTLTFRFMTYLTKHSSYDWMNEVVDLDLEEFEIADSVDVDYPFSFEEVAVAEATERLSRLDLPSEDPKAIDIANLKGGEVSLLRAAIGSLTHYEDSSLVERCNDFLVYAPVLTPDVIRYLISLGSANSGAAAVVVGLMSDDYSRNEWQAMWVVNAAREMSLLHEGSVGAGWVKEQLRRGQGGLLGAEAALALAGVGGVSFDYLDQALRLEPAPLAPLFVMSMGVLGAKQPELVQRVTAVKRSSPLFAALLD